MIRLEIHYEEGRKELRELNLPCHIGRAKESELQIRSWRVAKMHSVLFTKQKGLYLEDKGSLSGTLLNGQRVHQAGPLRVGDQIIIGPCLLLIKALDCHESLALRPQAEPISATISCTDNEFGLNAEPVMGDRSIAMGSTEDQVLVDEMRTFADPAKLHAPSLQLEIQHRQHLHNALLEALDLRRSNVVEMSDELLRAEADAMLDKLMTEDQGLYGELDPLYLKQLVLDEAIGLGPLEGLLKDAQISEIMVNRFDEIYVEKAGRLHRSATVFSSEKAVLGVIQRIVAPLGRRIDESSPMVDARLSDGSRVNAVIPPIALRGASITIRKFAQHRPQMKELIALGSMDQAMSEFLDICVRQRMNIIVSGGTGSGKTTLLNILSNCIPAQERIITIEDAAELRLNHQHLVSLEARPANIEGKGVVQIRDLVRNALRMRPDRIVVGECRGAESFDMLSAMNTGHEGSLTTLHANSARDALTRLETMILMADMDLPLTAIREHISASIDFIVQQSRLSNGRRVISAIVEVGGLESGVIKIQEIFKYVRRQQGGFVGTGIMPSRFEQLKDEGVSVDANMFNQTTMLTASMSMSLH